MAVVPRVLIADGHPISHQGLTNAAQEAIPTVPIDIASTIAEVEMLARLHSNYRVAVLGTDLPDAKGLSGLLQVQNALGPVPIVVLADSVNPKTAGAARELGAAAYVSKTWPLPRLVMALREVLNGGTVFPAPTRTTDRMLQAGEGLTRLSVAQLRVLVALASGRSNKQIAGDLGVTEATIKAHLSASFRKLGVQNRAQALMAMQPVLATG